MNIDGSFQYFYGDEADMFTFYKIPKILMKDDRFKSLSSDAKILYGLALDRMSLSIKNGWFDEEKREFIYFSIENIVELLNCGKNKAVSSMKELENIGLIEKKRQGMGKANVLYVKNFVVIETGLESRKANFLNPENRDSRIPQNKLQGSLNTGSNNTKENNTEMSNTESYHVISLSDRMGEDVILGYAALIKENISYDILLDRYPLDPELVEGIYELILETVISKNESMVIARSEYPMELVRSKFLKLNSMHIEYVIGCMQSNTTKVKNIKKYLLAALFNAPTTMSGYYQAEVNHDMPQYAMVK